MEKMILKEHSFEDVKKRIKNIKIDKSEYFDIKEIKKPKKFLFFKFKGIYEVQINIKNNKNTSKTKFKSKEKEIKNEDCKAPNPSKTCKLEQLSKEHFKKSGLNINIVSKELNDNKIIFTVNGKDAKAFYEKRGFLNLAKLLSLSTPKLKKRIEFFVENNNENFSKDKSLRKGNIKKLPKKDDELEIRKKARDAAKKVIETKKEKNLYGLNAAQRRWVHDELSNITNVETKSYGEDKNRYLKISYIKG